MTDEKKNKTKDPSQIFTLETDNSDTEDMPSVTRLLNRKSLNLASASKKTAPPPAAGSTAPPISTPPSLAPTPSKPPSPQIHKPLQVKPRAKKHSLSDATPLIIWDKEKLQKGADPLGKAIVHLMDRGGATSVIFLGISPAASATQIPLFKGTAAVRPDKRLPLWTGVHWDPNKFPEVWKQLTQAGTFEFPPPGSQTQVDSQRNTIRAAFGVEQEEYLLLARAGPTNACRGIAVFLSKKSLHPVVSSVLSLLQEALK